MACPFCQPWLDQTQVILENDHCLFLMQPQLVLSGSGLIIPRLHRETVFDLTPLEWEATYDLLQQVKPYLDKSFHPQGYSLGWNAGETAGQEIFHAHLHVIPRFADEPFAGRGIRYWLKQEANKRSGA